MFVCDASGYQTRVKLYSCDLWGQITVGANPYMFRYVNQWNVFKRGIESNPYLLNAKIELYRFSERDTVEDIVDAEAFCEYNLHVFTFNTIVTGRPSDRNRFLNKCFCMPSFITDRTPDIVINLGNCCWKYLFHKHSETHNFVGQHLWRMWQFCT